MKKSNLVDLQSDSDLIKAFRKDSNIQLVQSHKLRYRYTQHYFTLLLDKYTHLSDSVSKEIQNNIDEIVISQLNDCRDDYLINLDSSMDEVSISLMTYLEKNKFDFIISNSNLTRHLLDFNIFQPITVSRVSRKAFLYGKLMNKIDFYGCHSVEMDRDLIICGRKTGCVYNFELDHAYTLEDDSDCEIDVKYYFESVINKNDFVNLYLVRDKREKYRHLFRDKSIDDLLK